MIGIGATFARVEKLCDEGRMRVDAVLTAITRILVQAIVEETNRSLQRIERHLGDLHARVSRLEDERRLS